MSAPELPVGLVYWMPSNVRRLSGISRMVRGVIAGRKSLLGAVEENEDAYEEGRLAIQENGITASDVVVGLSATTPFVLGALDEASNRKAKTMAIINNPNPDLAKSAIR